MLSIIIIIIYYYYYLVLKMNVVLISTTDKCLVKILCIFNGTRRFLRLQYKKF